MVKRNKVFTCWSGEIGEPTEKNTVEAADAKEAAIKFVQKKDFYWDDRFSDDYYKYMDSFVCVSDCESDNFEIINVKRRMTPVYEVE